MSHSTSETSVIPTKAKLSWAIHAFLTEQGAQEVLPPEDFQFVVWSFEQWITNASRRFIRGSEEHGGSFINSHMDEDKERREEVIDAFFYDMKKVYHAQTGFPKTLPITQ